MVKPGELRLNNWILGKTRKPIKVVAIRDWLLDAETEFGFKTVEPKYLDGIPLTDEILQRAGFQFNIETLCWTYEHRRCTLVINDDHFAVINSVCGGPRLCVHRLQNLFEALTCEELNIKFF